MNSRQIERFWAKVDRRGPDDCWEWQRWRNGQGYGKLQIDGLNVYAHRIAYCINLGLGMNEARGRDFVIRHNCDNPACCNPCHLARGTQVENMADMRARGRQRELRGAEIAKSKLTEDDVVAIFDGRAGGATLNELAERFGVSDGTVSAVIRGRTWRHVGPPRTLKAKPHLTMEQVSSIKRGLTNGKPHAEIARTHGVSLSKVSDISQGRTWKNVP